MAVYFVTGKLGAGKTLVAVKRLQEYIQQGRRIATNLDVDINALLPGSTDRQRHVVRIPDKPTADDMAAIGQGYDGDEYDESRFGLVVLDELGTWLNSRTWTDKSRKAFIDWCIHARKLRWDIIFIVQNVQMVDAQVRDALCEHLVVCRRADRVKIAGIRMPKVHVGSVYYGATENPASKLERWVYRGRELYAAYDTAQAFSPFYDKGCYCPLIDGYFEPDELQDTKEDKRPAWRRLAGNPIAAASAGLAIGATAVSVASPEHSPVTAVAVAEIPPVAEEIEPVNWLQHLGRVRYAGTYTVGKHATHYITTDAYGTITADYFADAGAQVRQVAECALSVQWPDGQVSMVSCDAPDSELPPGEEI